MTKKIKIEDIEKLLSRLDSDESRINLLTKLMWNSRIAEEDFERVFEIYEEAGNFHALHSAVWIAGRLGMKERAIDYFERIQYFDHAARAAEDAKMFERAIENYEKAGKAGCHYFSAAAEIAEKQGMFERAIKNYAKAHCYGAVVRIANEKGITEKVISDYEEAKEYDVAAGIAKKAGMDERAKELYIRYMYLSQCKGNIRGAAWAAEEIGRLDLAVDIHAKGGNIKDALFIAREAGLFELVVDVYETAGNFVKAAEAAEEIGFAEKAVENYEKIGRFGKAREIAEKAGMPEKLKFYKEIELLLGENE
jgi:tetratricopeptide (TPR) repeat protein